VPRAPDPVLVDGERSGDHARSVAIMECLERTCALWPTSADVLVKTQEQLKQQSPWPVWGPERFTEGRA